MYCPVRASEIGIRREGERGSVCVNERVWEGEWGLFFSLGGWGLERSGTKKGRTPT
jgi:hypothetical protein